MKSTVDKLDGLSRKINVEVPSEKVQQAFARVYKALQKKANIKGFRAGKAPLATIRSIYGEQVKTDVVNDLIKAAYQSSLFEHKLEPIGYPKVSFSELQDGQPFSFTAEFEVRPEASVKNFENLAVVKEKLELSSESVRQRVDETLQQIRHSLAETVVVFEDRALANGDLAEINFRAHVRGEALPNGAADGHLLEIGSKQFIDGFEEGLIGMRVGESRTLHLNFPANYREATLSGAPVIFEIKLTSIKRKVLPEVNDELAKKIGEFATLDALKTQIQKDFAANEEQRIAEELHNRIIKALVDANPIQAPKSLVAQQKESLLEDFKDRMKQQGQEAEFEERKKMWDAEFENSATFMVKSTFLIDSLAEKLDLRAKPSEIEAKINQFASRAGAERGRVYEFYTKPENRSRIAFQISEEKVVKYLLSKAKVSEVGKDKLPKIEEI